LNIICFEIHGTSLFGVKVILLYAL